jgi:hypothetical protein
VQLGSNHIAYYLNRHRLYVARFYFSQSKGEGREKAALQRSSEAAFAVSPCDCHMTSDAVAALIENRTYRLPSTPVVLFLSKIRHYRSPQCRRILTFSRWWHFFYRTAC